MRAFQADRCLLGAPVLIAALLAGCGGGSAGSSDFGSGSGNSSSAPASSSSYVPGQYLKESQYAARCASPRTGTDPVTGVAYPDVQGTATDENNFLRSWTHDLYLWYSAVPDLDPSLYTTADYFPVLKTSATTSSGAPVDRFHFTYTTAYWESLSQQGVAPGYGVDFEVVASTPPREAIAAYQEPSATGAAATIARGATIQSIDGVSINDNTQSGIDTLNAGLFPATVGESHVFTIQDAGSSTTRTVTLVAADITETPVLMTTVPQTDVGYIVFNEQIATAESELANAITQLQGQGVHDLVLDMRYNGGGYLDIASELAYEIAGAAQTSGHTFELQQFNDQHPSINPVTGSAITPTLFHSTSQGFDPALAAGTALPSLNLSRVFVLATDVTCSASEAIINGLRGIGVQVILVGSTTCGKPYGFYPQDNCGTTYFSIQFRGVNDQGFGDYPAGFSPTGSTGETGVVIPGCPVSDDYTHALGDTSEALLSAALTYQQTGSCPVPSSIAPGANVKRQSQSGGLPLPGRPQARQIRILKL